MNALIYEAAFRKNFEHNLAGCVGNVKIFESGYSGASVSK